MNYIYIIWQPRPVAQVAAVAAWTAPAAEKAVAAAAATSEAVAAAAGVRLSSVRCFSQSHGGVRETTFFKITLAM